jgi:hypothetical protein
VKGGPLSDHAGTVFISYTHDSSEHAAKVLILSDRLRADGIDCVLDQYELSPPEGWPQWMDREIKKAQFVIMICTEAYLRRVNGDEIPGIGLGLAWEGKLIYNHIYAESSRNTKFIPVVFEAAHAIFIPAPIQGATRYNLGVADGYDRLYSRLIGRPPAEKPPLGKRKPLPEREVRTTFSNSSPTVATLTKLDLNLREAMDYLQAMVRAGKFDREIPDEEYGRLCNASADSARATLREGGLFIPPQLVEHCERFLGYLREGLMYHAGSRREDFEPPQRAASWHKAGDIACRELPVILNEFETAARRIIHEASAPEELPVNKGPLRIDIGETGEFFETRRGSAYRHTRILKLRISNTDRHKSLFECKVHITDITPHEYEGPWLLKEGFSLAAGDHQFVPLASYTEPGDIKRPPYGDTFMEILVTKNRPKPSSIIEHVLTMRATALDSPFCEIKCKLWVDDHRRLRIAAIQ